MQNKKEYDYNKFLGETPKFPSIEEYMEDCGIDAEHLSLEDEEHLKSTLDHWSCHIASHELYWKYARAIASALRENDCCCSGDIIDKNTFEDILFNYLAPKIGMEPKAEMSEDSF